LSDITISLKLILHGNTGASIKGNINLSFYVIMLSSVITGVVSGNLECGGLLICVLLLPLVVKTNL